ncbi:MAG: hypothetical protein U1E17_00960 [Geminicoccaceae bacterium]
MRADLDINLLDFGCIRVFKPSFVKGVIDLYWALQRSDRELAVEAYRSWGFEKPAQQRHGRRAQRMGRPISTDP